MIPLLSLPRVLLRALGVAAVAFCTLTVSPAMAQPAQTIQTFTLNGLWADVMAPQLPVRLGEAFWMSVALRPHGDAVLQEYHVFLDARPLGRRDGIELMGGYSDGIPDNREWSEAASLYAAPGDIALRFTVTKRPDAAACSSCRCA